MKKPVKADLSVPARWARFRFAVIGSLLAAPPKVPGELKAALVALSAKDWPHPITEQPTRFAVSTIERWYYQGLNSTDPIDVLRRKTRADASIPRKLSDAAKCAIRQQYGQHPGWSYQLHFDNLIALMKQTPTLGELPTYHTVRRYMKKQGFIKRHASVKRHTAGAALAAQRLEQREVRSYEMDDVHGLWHLDFHHGSRKLLGKEGQWIKPMLLAIMDDHSRLICHAQWYLDETVESLVHGVKQALQKRGVPRALMSDNGAAMIAAEFVEGLERLSILHQPTLPYSPYQNGKQETFWGQIEGRLMAMLEGESELTLALLNEATLAWIEGEYHHKLHSETNATPMTRYLKSNNVGRDCPETTILHQAFTAQIHRKQRKSDGTVTVNACRFEVPSHYRHVDSLILRYTHWDLSRVFLANPQTNACVATLYPQDKSANATGLRRTFNDVQSIEDARPATNSGVAPLLKQLMADYAATGLPPAYLPKGENQ